MDRQPSWNPPEDSGIAIRFVEANGLTFEVAEAGPVESDHLALCLHGFPELHYSWRHQIPLLAAKGYRVWAPNMRGYGASDRPGAVRNYALDHLTQDIAALIEASGAKKVTLVAHDWGAIVAWMFAILKLRPLERLVIMNVPHPMCSIREIGKWRQFRKSWYIFFFQLPKLPETVLARRTAGSIIASSACNRANFGPEIRAVYDAAAARTGARQAMVNYYRALLRHQDVVDPGDYRVEVPTLMVWGEEDVAIDIHCLDGTQEWVPDLTIERLPGVSHWVQQDAPGAVNDILERWLPGGA
ncbi:alpha/beta fold hydrolase [Altererythrobacter sp. MTPC7]|uniref:alpha/beta fold hydrolase n=1 Tax=Altererythrobacter sp. MTPC7 TaxID=3056567 RepID=UPI0036F2CE90